MLHLRNNISGLCFLAIAMLSGCSEPNAKAVASDDPTASENDELKQIELLKARVSLLELENSKDIVLKLSGTGFTPLQTDVGTITSQLKHLEANGSGSQVDLLIGNPTSASITNLNIEGSWGILKSDGTLDPNNEHDFTTNTSELIPAASWQHIHFNIDGGKPTEIGYIRIKAASIQQVRLHGYN